MDAVASKRHRARAWTLLVSWSGYGCSVKWMHLNVDVNTNGAWMLWRLLGQLMVLSVATVAWVSVTSASRDKVLVIR